MADKKVWTKEIISQDLRAAYASGIRINTVGLRGYKRGLIRAAQDSYGSLAKAALEAGVPYTSIKYYSTPESVLVELRSLAKSGMRMRAKELYAVRPGLAYAAKKHFKSLLCAIESAGLEYENRNKLPPKKVGSIKHQQPVFEGPYPSIREEYRLKYKAAAETGRRPRCGYF